MSKPRSMLVGKPDHAFRTVRGFTTVLHFGKQAKHIRGQPNHDPTKSEITVSITELQNLVELRAGSGKWNRQGTRETIDFGVVIGVHRDGRTGKSTPSSWGTIHYSKSGAHVVPANPDRH